MTPTVISVAIIMVAVGIASIVWLQGYRVAASTRRMKGMMTRVGLDFGTATLDDPRTAAPARALVRSGRAHGRTHDARGVQGDRGPRRGSGRRTTESLRPYGQPVIIGGSMGPGFYVLVGARAPGGGAFASACHGAGRAMSRRRASKRWKGRAVVDELAGLGIVIRSPSLRGVAEEAPGRLQRCRRRGPLGRARRPRPAGGPAATHGLRKGLIG